MTIPPRPSANWSVRRWRDTCCTWHVACSRYKLTCNCIKCDTRAVASTYMWMPFMCTGILFARFRDNRNIQWSPHQRDSTQNNIRSPNHIDMRQSILSSDKRDLADWEWFETGVFDLMESQHLWNVWNWHWIGSSSRVQGNTYIVVFFYRIKFSLLTNRFHELTHAHTLTYAFVAGKCNQFEFWIAPFIFTVLWNAQTNKLYFYLRRTSSTCNYTHIIMNDSVKCHWN